MVRAQVRAHASQGVCERTLLSMRCIDKPTLARWPRHGAGATFLAPIDAAVQVGGCFTMLWVGA